MKLNELPWRSVPKTLDAGEMALPSPRLGCMYCLVYHKTHGFSRCVDSDNFFIDDGAGVAEQGSACYNFQTSPTI
jgi:hypothetical protein